MFADGLAARIESFGKDDVTCGRALGSLALLRLQQGRVAEAFPDLERALAILEPKLGAAHAWTQKAKNDLAAALVAAGETARTLPLREQTLADQRRVLGPEHPTRCCR